MLTNYPHTVLHNNMGFTTIKPIKDETHFISWSSIDTIIFSPNRHSEDCAQWIIYLSKPPKITLKPNAWWLNKVTFFLTSKKNRKIRIRDDFNKDFYIFPEMVEKYLNQSATFDYEEDDRKGKLISKKVTVKENKTITQEYWKPKRSDELPWKMLYDRYGRTVQEIYDRDGSI